MNEWVNQSWLKDGKMASFNSPECVNSRWRLRHVTESSEYDTRQKLTCVSLLDLLWNGLVDKSISCFKANHSASDLCVSIYNELQWLDYLVVVVVVVVAAAVMNLHSDKDLKYSGTSVSWFKLFWNASCSICSKRQRQPHYFKLNWRMLSLTK